MDLDLKKERKEIEKAFDIFVSSNNLNFNFEYIKELIYNSDENWLVKGGKKYTQFWMDIFDEYDIDFSQNLIDLTASCWNYSPHKVLNGKCPAELYLWENNN